MTQVRMKKTSVNKNSGRVRSRAAQRISSVRAGAKKKLGIVKARANAGAGKVASEARSEANAKINK